MKKNHNDNITKIVDNSTINNDEITSDSLKNDRFSRTALVELIKFDKEDGSINSLSSKDIEKCIESAGELLQIFLNDDMESSKIYAMKFSKSYYHMILVGLMETVEAICTLSQDDLKKAKSAIEKSIHICNSHRKSIGLSNFTSLIWKVNYNSYTNDEIHAELCLGLSYLLLSLLDFCEQTFIGLVKAAYRFNTADSLFKTCINIVNIRQFEEEKNKMQYEALLKFGYGAINLLLSHLPTKVINILSLIGWSFDAETAKKDLISSAQLKNCIGSTLSSIFLCLYNLYLEQLFGLNEGDFDVVDEALKELSKNLSESFFIIFFKGKVFQLHSDQNKALELFNVACSKITKAKYNKFKNFVHWDIIWCESLNRNWSPAAQIAEVLSAETHWSPATNKYQQASFLYMLYSENGEKDQELKMKINKAMSEIPGLRVNYAGKCIPPEKFAINRSKKYFQQNGRLTLPALELLFIWNMFSTCKGEAKYLEPFLNIIEKEEEKIKVRDDKNKKDDDLLCLFLKGVIFRNLQKYDLAIKCYLEVIKSADKISEKYLVPNAACEIGISYMYLGKYEESRTWLKNSKDNYSGYLAETIVHLKVHIALAKLKDNFKENKFNRKYIIKRSISNWI